MPRPQPPPARLSIETEEMFSPPRHWRRLNFKAGREIRRARRRGVARHIYVSSAMDAGTLRVIQLAVFGCYHDLRTWQGGPYFMRPSKWEALTTIPGRQDTATALRLRSMTI